MNDEYISLLEEDYNGMLADIECYEALVEILRDILEEHGVDYSVNEHDITAKMRMGAEIN